MKQNPTTLAYKYIFVCQGDVFYKGHRLKAVGLTLALKLYRYGNILPIPLEPMYNGHFLNELFDVSINKFDLYKVEKNRFMEKIFKGIFKFDDSNFEEIEFTAEILTDETVVNNSETVPVQKVKSIRIPKQNLETILKENMSFFLLQENKKAEVEKVSFVELRKE